MSSIPPADLPSPAEASLSRLRRLARKGEWIAGLSLISVVAYAIFLSFNRAELKSYLLQSVPPGGFNTASDFALTLGGLASLVPCGIFMLILFEAWRLFRLFGHGQGFDRAVPSSLAKLGRLALVAAFASVVARTAVVLAMTMDAPPGHHLLSIGISSSDIASVIIGVLFFAFAELMNQAIRLADESKDFI